MIGMSSLLQPLYGLSPCYNSDIKNSTASEHMTFTLHTTGVKVFSHMTY